jgi:hypothetical protein
MSQKQLRLLAVLCVVGCSDTRVYTPEADDAAMAKIERSWAGPETADPIGTVTICEDRARADQAAAAASGNDCEFAHVVRGGGRGTPQMRDVGGVGCGGCEFQVLAYVTATVETFAGTTTTLTGNVYFASAEHGDTSTMPYKVVLNDTAGDSLVGNIVDNGSLVITSFTLGAMSISSPVTLSPVGTATCATP